MIGQPLQHVANVDDKRARRRTNLEPLSVLAEQFQASFLGAKKQGDEVDVLVRTGTDRAASIVAQRRIVQQTQD